MCTQQAAPEIGCWRSWLELKPTCMRLAGLGAVGLVVCDDVVETLGSGWRALKFPLILSFKCEGLVKGVSFEIKAGYSL